jgi:mxaJ protein
MLALAALLIATAPAPAPAPRPVLRVCADPNNLPFSNRRGEGFENRIATLLARAMHADLAYTWWAQRRGFFRHTLATGACDVVIGVPARLELVTATRPYYRGSYAFVTVRARRLHIESFDDPRLRRLRVGVPIVGDDGENPPPAYALGRRGIVDNVAGFSVYGDYATESPPSRILEALARGEIDVAIVWGPLAGAFARRRRVALEIAPVAPTEDGGLPFAFDIAIGVRRGDADRRRALDELLADHRVAIERILHEYGIPRLR